MATKAAEPVQVRFRISSPGLTYGLHGIERGQVVEVPTSAEAARLYAAGYAQPPHLKGAWRALRAIHQRESASRHTLPRVLDLQRQRPSPRAVVSRLSYAGNLAHHVVACVCEQETPVGGHRHPSGELSSASMADHCRRCYPRCRSRRRE